MKKPPFHLTPGGTRLITRLYHAMHAGREWNTDSVCVFIGSRYGENVFALAEYFPGSIIGIDEDSEALLYTRMAGAAFGKRVVFRYMSPLQLDFPEAHADLIILDGLLSSYHSRKLLAECHRVLKPAAPFALTTPVWLAGNVPTFVRDVWSGKEYQVPDAQALSLMLLESGFVDINIEDVSRELTGFYSQFTEDVRKLAKSDDEIQKQHKALVKHYKHEIDVYMKLGGKKHMGYAACKAVKSTSVQEEAQPARQTE